MLDIPDSSHQFASANGIRIHYVRMGKGEPLILLHGWPEYWRVWRKLIPLLAQQFDVIAPDLRGFGDTEKPSGTALEAYTLDHHVNDINALADALGFKRFGLVGHDIGSYISQEYARRFPQRLTGLFFFDCPNPGIGKRWGDPAFMLETWYQYLNQQPWAAEFIGSSRKACELYLRHFLDHHAHKPGGFDADMEDWIDTYLRDGNMQGGFNWYLALQPARLHMMLEGSPKLEPIAVRTRVRWGVSDKILKPEFADRLGEYFVNPDVKIVPDVGHFVGFERPEYSAGEITSFFS